MTRHLRIAVLAAVVVGGALSTACATSINHVLADPSRYRDREVTIKGYVEDSVSVMARGVYRVRDDSGQLWVVSAQGVPRKGARVTVKGTVRDAFNVGSFGGGLTLPAGISGVILVETEHQASR